MRKTVVRGCCDNTQSKCCDNTPSHDICVPQNRDAAVFLGRRRCAEMKNFDNLSKDSMESGFSIYDSLRSNQPFLIEKSNSYGASSGVAASERNI